MRRASLYARSLLEASLDPLVTISPRGQDHRRQRGHRQGHRPRPRGAHRHRLLRLLHRARERPPGLPRGLRQGLGHRLPPDHPGAATARPPTSSTTLPSTATRRATSSVSSPPPGTSPSASGPRRRSPARPKNSRTPTRTSQRFAYVASHDLQEPLRMVTSYLQLIEQRYRDRLDENGLVFINYAVDGATRMQQLINGLLTLSRVATKGRAPGRGRLRTWLSSWPTRNLALGDQGKRSEDHPRSASPSSWPTRPSSARSFRTCSPTRSNSAPMRTPEIHVDAVSEKGHWLFRVRDNGIGIDKEYAERIFGIFQRLHSRGGVPGNRHRPGHLQEDRRAPPAAASGSSRRPEAGRPSTSHCPSERRRE